MDILGSTASVLRRATPADAPAIAALTAAAYSKYIVRMGREPQPMRTDYVRVVAEHPVWLLEAAGELLGVLVLMHEPDALLIYNVAVSPQYQRHGYGRQLLAYTEAQARAAGYAHIRLYTNALMTENIALYTRLGYHETGREAFGELTRVNFAKALGPGNG